MQNSFHSYCFWRENLKNIKGSYKVILTRFKPLNININVYIIIYKNGFI